MKVNIIKPHGSYSLGITEVDDARGSYLIKMKVAEMAGAVKQPTETTTQTAPKEPSKKQGKKK